MDGDCSLHRNWNTLKAKTDSQLSTGGVKAETLLVAFKVNPYPTVEHNLTLPVGPSKIDRFPVDPPVGNGEPRVLLVRSRRFARRR